MSNNRAALIAATIGAGLSYIACLTYRTLAAQFRAAPKRVTFSMSDIMRKKLARQTIHDCLLKYATQADGRRTIHTIISIARCVDQYASLETSERLMTDIIFHSGDHVVAELVSHTDSIQRKITAYKFNNPYSATLQAKLMDIDMDSTMSTLIFSVALENTLYDEWRDIHRANEQQTTQLTGVAE